MIYGYARVSTTGQTLEAQIDALKAAGAEKVFQEKVSGAKGDRPQLARLLAAVQAEDAVYFTTIDRFARSAMDFYASWQKLSAAGATFKAIHQPMANPETPEGRLFTGQLALWAEFERTLIVERTTTGRKRAKIAGRKLGPKYKLTSHQIAEARQALKDGSATAADLARRYGVHRSTIGRIDL